MKHIKHIENVFLRFLKENNCYYKFIKNINSDHAFDESYKFMSITELFDNSNNPIGFGFSWNKSYEGRIYWDIMSRKWECILYNINKNI